MPDIFDENGLQVATTAEIVTDLETSWYNIYGDDINLSQNTSDGQLLNIIAQGQTDTRGLLLQIYNSFDPDSASGVLLDRVAKFYNITRNAGTFTIVPIVVTTNREVTLQGLDDQYNNIEGSGYTIQDDAGNQFILINTTTVPAGTATLNFRARNIGQVNVTNNTITTPVTVVVGVTGVNNPNAPINIGSNEETDAQFRLRIRRSRGKSSSGYLDSILAEVLDLDGVTDATIYENYTDVTDSRGIPPHCIWLIVEGGSSADIAQALYAKKSSGSNMKGEIQYTIISVYGTIFTAKWDESTATDLYIKFDIKKTTSTDTYDLDALKEYIINNIHFQIGGVADSGTVTCVARTGLIETGGQGSILNTQISTDNANWTNYLTAGLGQKFAINTITITVVD